MRVQRAPNAADQPYRPPLGNPAPAAFSAQVDLDLTDLLSRLDESGVAGEVVVRLVAALRAERLVDDSVVLQVVSLTEGGIAGVQLGPAVNQSAYSVSSALRASPRTLPATTARTLTVVHLAGSRVQALGDWGREGVVTLGPVIPTLVPSQSHGLSVLQRSLSRLGITLRISSADMPAAVRALDTVAQSVETRAT